ncbi:unnamed protein product [Brassica napus]|uniref:(rape) hypothetical protein n=1 Tax=Brassica napus TaxID=3708 RepID=A0A816P9Y7_BRANA|nr:unnamed protein product [Brassica napus]
MATSQISLSELKAGRSSECEEKWSKSTCDSWMIREGAMYEVSEFEMTRCNNHFKFCDSNLAIQFNNFTKFIEVHAVPNPIPTEKIRLHKFEELMNLANTNVQLPNPYLSYIFGHLIPASFALSEIIGEVSNIRTIYNDKSQTTQRVMVHIKIDKLETGVRRPTVMLAISINPKLVGVTRLCATTENDSTSVTKYGGVKKLETISLPDWNTYVLTLPQVFLRLCLASGNAETHYVRRIQDYFHTNNTTNIHRHNSQKDIIHTK